MKMLFHSIKKIIWLLIVGTMIAFHNFYQQEFKGVEKQSLEIVEDEEE